MGENTEEKLLENFDDYLKSEVDNGIVTKEYIDSLIGYDVIKLHRRKETINKILNHGKEKS